MGVKLVSSGGGSVEINPPATASNFTATMPAGTGNVVVNGVNGALVSATAVSASGTSVDFTGIPSWVKRITVMFSGVSTSGTSNILVQLGDAGGVETTSYVSSANNAGTNASSTIGLLFTQSTLSSSTHYGSMIISLLSSNTWVYQGIDALTVGAIMSSAGGKTLSDTLTQVRITTVNGTDTFDAGSINIMYE